MVRYVPILIVIGFVLFVMWDWQNGSIEFSVASPAKPMMAAQARAANIYVVVPIDVSTRLKGLGFWFLGTVATTVVSLGTEYLLCKLGWFRRKKI